MTALHDRGRLVYNTYRKSAKARNIARDPRTCSLLLADYDAECERALVYKGSARRVDPARVTPSQQGLARPARQISGAIPERVNARLESGTRVLLAVDAEEIALLGPADGS
jgi:hypothetical protein